MFTRDGASAYKADLHNTIEFCKRLGNPQQRFKSVHIAGTNGKGSTSHMLAAILQIAGYKTGLYTSPHLKDFRERIRINGIMITEQTVIDFVADHTADFEQIKPSFFEMTVGLAFEVFANETVDIAIIEVGLGGRLDSTNIITPLLSVITNIGYDHMNILGDTLQLIAGEKAGIIKPGIPLVIGEYQPDTAQIFIQKAKKEGSKLLFASDVWQHVNPETKKLNGSEKNGDHLKQFLEVPLKKSVPGSGQSHDHALNVQLDLTGSYQIKNVKTVLSAVDELRLQGFHITDDNIVTALQQVITLTGLHGRWEVLSHHPLTICDTGHNADGITEVLKNIATVNYKHLHFILGMVNDKDINKILGMLPVNATYYFCKPGIPRGLDAESLKLQAKNYGLQGAHYSSVTQAMQAAQQNADEHDLIFIGGSTFVVAEAM